MLTTLAFTVDSERALATHTTKATAGAIHNTTDTIVFAPHGASCEPLQSPRVQGAYVIGGESVWVWCCTIMLRSLAAE
jgi:hypothetical protein